MQVERGVVLGPNFGDGHGQKDRASDVPWVRRVVGPGLLIRRHRRSLVPQPGEEGATLARCGAAWKTQFCVPFARWSVLFLLSVSSVSVVGQAVMSEMHSVLFEPKKRNYRSVCTDRASNEALFVSPV